MLNWIGFNPETHRAYVKKDGTPAIEPVPQEILELRQLDEYATRVGKAALLASQGFIIDGPIDVSGWNPKNVTASRQAYGYTWVPSFMQPNIRIVPGIGQPGVSPYDPGAASPGSILVPPL